MPGTASISGLISGMQTDEILSKILALKQQPVNLLNKKKAALTEKLTAWQEANARLLALKLKAQDLQSSSAFQLKSASVSDNTVLTASASTVASNGTFTLTVNRLAKAHQIGSESFSSSTGVGVGAGALTIKNKSTGQEWTVTIAPGADNLESVRDAINAAGSDASATIINDGSGTPYRLVLTSKITGSAGELEVTASGGTTLSFNNVITPAENAEVKFGSGAGAITVTSSTNTVTNAIPGVTLNLLKASVGTEITVNISADSSALVSRVKGFVEMFNSFVDFRKSVASFDPDTLKGGALLGEFSLQTIESDLAGIINRPVSGLSGIMSALSGVGVRLGTDGKLTVDESVLTAKISEDPQSVARIFARTGTATDSSISFLNATSSTRQSSGVGYAVEITRLATQTRVTAGRALEGVLGQAETLTVNNIEIKLNAGMTLGEVVSAINAKQSLTGVIASATLADGTGTGNYLTLKSVGYGSSTSVSAVSSVSNTLAGTSGIGNVNVMGNSPMGEGGLGTGQKGEDVAGTINGESAVGSGRTLTGMAGNATTDGLAIFVKSESIGSKGFVTYTKGTAAAIYDTLANVTDISTGLLTLQQQGIQNEIDQLQVQMNNLVDRLSLEENRIRQQFAMMESALSKYQTQGQYLAASLAGLVNSQK